MSNSNKKINKKSEEPSNNNNLMPPPAPFNQKQQVYVQKDIDTSKPLYVTNEPPSHFKNVS